MWWVLTLLIIAMLAGGLMALYSRSPGRRLREDDYEQRFGPLG